MLGLGLGIFAGSGIGLARYDINGKSPAIIADFALSTYAMNGGPLAFTDLFSFARLSAAWKLDALGNWVKVLAGEPRTGHHIVKDGALVPAGVAVCSEVRTNLLLNSDDLATQSVTVTAVEHTLSFTGPGTVTLSGAATNGPLAGAGSGEVNRVSLTFTPSAGSLTLTVSGDVENAKLETGPYATDYISTEGAPVSTASESLQIDDAEVSTAFGGVMPDAVSIVIEGYMTYEDEDLSVQSLMYDWGTAFSDALRGYVNTINGTGDPVFRQWVGGVSDIVENQIPNNYSPGANVPFSIASRHGGTFINGAAEGTALTANLTPAALADLITSAFQIATVGNMNITRLLIFADDIGDAGLVEATA